jgi:hypothetical protein
MAVSRSLRRLLTIRDLVEEQSRLALETALAKLNQLNDALEDTAGRDRRGRRLAAASAHNGELIDRLAGLEETRTAARFAKALAPRVGAAERDVEARREVYFAHRVERRQAETLISEAEAEESAEAGRRAQQALDDWHRFRLHQGK